MTEPVTSNMKKAIRLVISEAVNNVCTWGIPIEILDVFNKAISNKLFTQKPFMVFMDTVQESKELEREPTSKDAMDNRSPSTERYYEEINPPWVIAGCCEKVMSAAAMLVHKNYQDVEKINDTDLEEAEERFQRFINGIRPDEMRCDGKDYDGTDFRDDLTEDVEVEHMIEALQIIHMDLEALWMAKVNRKSEKYKDAEGSLPWGFFKRLTKRGWKYYYVHNWDQYLKLKEIEKENKAVLAKDKSQAKAVPTSHMDY